MGAGKTLSMTSLAYKMQIATGAPILANYALKDPLKWRKFTTLKELWDTNNAIICFDEIWLTMDSRLWANNVAYSRFIMHTRKKNIILLYTTQHPNQVDIRLRRATDIMIYTEKNTDKTHWLNFVDWQWQKLGRRYLLGKPENFYKLYDTFEEIQPITLGEKKFNVYNNK